MRYGIRMAMGAAEKKDILRMIVGGRPRARSHRRRGSDPAALAIHADDGEPKLKVSVTYRFTSLVPCRDALVARVQCSQDYCNGRRATRVDPMVALRRVRRMGNKMGLLSTGRSLKDRMLAPQPASAPLRC